MRLAFSLDDQLAKRLDRAAAEEGMSVSAFIAKALNGALMRREASGQTPFRLITVRGGQPRDGIDLYRPRVLDIIEDEIQFGTRST